MKSEKFSSPLSWNRAKFIEMGEEIPDKLLEDDLHTEGELMTQEELEAWTLDSIKTFCVVRETNETLFEELFQEFTEDLGYLVFLGKISDTDAHELLNKKLYTP